MQKLILDQILTQKQVLQKIKRIAYEIYENNLEEKELIFVGVIGSGYEFATMLEKTFNQISNIKTGLFKISLNKLKPLNEKISINCPTDILQDKVIIIVDDILKTGKTLYHCLSPFSGISIKKLQVAILVDRNYRSFPISADYKGYELSTTINEHIEVKLSEKGLKGVFLF